MSGWVSPRDDGAGHSAGSDFASAEGVEVSWDGVLRNDNRRSHHQRSTSPGGRRQTSRQRIRRRQHLAKKRADALDILSLTFPMRDDASSAADVVGLPFMMKGTSVVRHGIRCPACTAVACRSSLSPPKLPNRKPARVACLLPRPRRQGSCRQRLSPNADLIHGNGWSLWTAVVGCAAMGQVVPKAS